LANAALLCDVTPNARPETLLIHIKFQANHMKTREILTSALASALALGLLQPAQAHMDGNVPNKERCFGNVKAGENDCANLAGTHDCAGAAAVDNDPSEWKLVAKGTCAKLGGKTLKQAQAAMKKAREKAQAAKPKAAEPTPDQAADQAGSTPSR
jgi:uncharacterized membrane protein